VVTNTALGFHSHINAKVNVLHRGVLIFSRCTAAHDSWGRCVKRAQLQSQRLLG
jgi:hypothetical protein